MTNFNARSISGITKAYFENDLSKFLRRHKKQYFYQLTYIRTFRKWQKKKRTEKARAIILKLTKKLPAECNDIANIMLTLEKFYGWEINKDNAEICCNIHFTLRQEMIKHYSTLSGSKKISLSTKYQTKRSKAFLEQKARGFIKQSDFDDYNEMFAHVKSTIDYRYIYPKNILRIPFSVKERVEAQKDIEKNLVFESVYRGLSSIGVSGYTKIELPKR